MYIYGRCRTVDLSNSGLVFLTGRNEDCGNNPNDVGKSNLLKAISRLLCDDDGTKHKAGAAVNSVWNKGSWGYLEFNKEHDKYRIISTRKWKKSNTLPDQSLISEPSDVLISGNTYTGTNLFFEQWDGNKWADRRAGKRMEDTRSHITEILGMNYDDFCSVSYLAQRRGIRLLEAKPKERFEILAPLAELGVWNKITKIIDLELQTLRESIARFQGQTDEIQNQMANINIIDDATIKNLENNLIAIENEIYSISKEINEKENLLNKSDIDKRTEINNKIREIENKVISDPVDLVIGLNEWNTKLTEYNNKKTTLYNEEIKAKLDITYKDGTVEIKPKISELNGLINNKFKSVEKLSSANEGVCDSCGSKITKANLDKHIIEINKEIRQYQKEKEDLENKLKIEEDRINKYVENEKLKIVNEYNDKINEVSLLIAQANTMIDNIKLEIENHKEKEIEVRDKQVIELKNQLNKLGDDNTNEVHLALTNLKNRLKQLENDKTSINLEINSAKQNNINQANKLQDCLSRINDINGNIKSQQDNLSVYTNLKKEFGHSGIQAFEIGSLIDEFNHHVSEYIYHLTDGLMKITLSPYKEKKTAKNVLDHIAEITALVSDSFKQDVPIDLYGGAATQQIILSMLLGFRAISISRGVGTNFMGT